MGVLIGILVILAIIFIVVNTEDWSSFFASIFVLILGVAQFVIPTILILWVLSYLIK